MRTLANHRIRTFTLRVRKVGGNLVTTVRPLIGSIRRIAPAFVGSPGRELRTRPAQGISTTRVGRRCDVACGLTLARDRGARLAHQYRGRAAGLGTMAAAASVAFVALLTCAANAGTLAPICGDQSYSGRQTTDVDDALRFDRDL